MKLPFWTRVWTHKVFAWGVGLGGLALASFARKRDTGGQASVMTIVTILSVVTAIALPVFIRRKAQRRLGRAQLPLWTNVWTSIDFAWVVGIGLLVVAREALRRAALFARFDLDPLARQQHDNAKAIVMTLISMLLVVGGIVLPLVVRRKAQRRLGEV
jgi:hypothetical protein